MMMTGTSMVHSALSRRRPALPHQFRELHQAHGRLLGHRQSVGEQQVARVIWLFFWQDFMHLSYSVLHVFAE